ncbi:phosphoglucomutase/phosphomannomutase family protein [Saprospiraceae bacterium]|nr:phosphoglucomutase/phosphomannomutase family protein [Saprospiraceae bacterium]
MIKPIKIKFGTDGWRAIIARDYTLTNVRRVAEGTAIWMVNNGMKKVVIGHDCRFGGPMFSQATAEVFTAYGIEVHRAVDFVSTPMVSLGVVALEADLGVVITASHNPPDYNGFKLKSALGGPSIPKDIAAVEEEIPDYSSIETGDRKANLELIHEVDLEEIYYNKVMNSFDIDSIRNAKFGLVYDCMYGAGQRILPRILPSATMLHNDTNPGFQGQAPEPIERNLGEQSATIKSLKDSNIGLATDGDADRIGLFDEEGEFVDSHNILMLLLYYLAVEKNMTGKVVVTFSVTEKMEKLAAQLGMEIQITKIGFKYIAEIMIEEDVLVGGEESGGLAVKGFIPERDGIWIGLTIMEFMAKSGKTLKELVAMIHDRVGTFKFNRDDLHLTEEKKKAVIAKCQEGNISDIGGIKVKEIQTLDGFKFFFENEGEWVMIRPSGTEPVLRVYAQAENMDRVREILDTTHAYFQ